MKREETMKFTISGLIISICIIIVFAISVQLPAQGQQNLGLFGHKPGLVEFDAPGAATVTSPACSSVCGTQPLGNNVEGVIVGSYTDANVVPHGFLRTPDGNITSFDAPGAGLGANLDEGTVAYTINDLGVVVGQFEDPSEVFHGFLRYADGSFTIIDAPGAGTGAGQGTLATSINFQGAAAGFYIDGSNEYHGFARSREGEITTFDPTGSVFTFVCEETCLNAAGAITGSWQDSTGAQHGFIREPDGTITSFDPPGSAGITESASINLEGTTTGYYLDSSSVIHGFLRTRAGNFTTLDAPEAGTGAVQGTGALSINTLGAVTGEYIDSNNVMHGFSREAFGNYATFDAPGAGTSAGQGTRPSTNNLSGAVTGWWVDGNGLNHGFVWYPRRLRWLSQPDCASRNAFTKLMQAKSRPSPTVAVILIQAEPHERQP
jgi:hypothetical protein